MDLYLPDGRSPNSTKVIIIIHGGGWNAGTKEEMQPWADWFVTSFPQTAIVNLEYRLGSIENPGYPMQINDIQAAIEFLKGKRNDYQIDNKYGLVGGSAGAHLSMLYGYAFDPLKVQNNQNHDFYYFLTFL